MKSMVTVERLSCDTCGKEAHEWSRCSWCGADLCYDCKTDHRRELFMNSSADPRACPKCEKRILAHPSLLGPLLEIERLINEMEGWNKSFTARREAAEAKTKDWLPSS